MKLTRLYMGLFLIALTFAQAAAKPNFIVIFCDDLGYGNIGPFGSTKHATPVLDKVAKDIHEDKNAAIANSKMVKQLLAYAEAARKDLGDTGRIGKGQRKASWVEKTLVAFVEKVIFLCAIRTCIF